MSETVKAEQVFRKGLWADCTHEQWMAAKERDRRVVRRFSVDLKFTPLAAPQAAK